MSKILQNTTASPVVLTDVGATVPASGTYLIDPSQYSLFAASSNTIAQIGSGVLTVNDGSSTLSIAAGSSLIQGLFPTNINISDGYGLKLSATGGDLNVALNDGTGNAISSTSGALNVNLTNTPTVNQGTPPWKVTPTDGVKATYSAAIVGLATVATPTDVFTITGSATKTIRVTRIAITGTQTTATQRDILIIKRSTANTGGTSSTLTAVPHDSTGASATATVRAYTANPTALGTAVGNIRTRKVFIGTTTGNSDEFIIDFGIRPSQALVVRGVAEVLSINLNSVTSAGGNLDISIEWTEE